MTATFSCPDCALKKDLAHVYIYKFAEEKEKAAASPIGDLQARVRTGEVKTGDLFCCIQCHRLKGRMQRIMAASGLQEDWAAISQHQKQKFRQEHSDALGANLTKVLTEVVEEEFLKQSWSKFAAKGDLLDETDMKAKYKD